jgi:hypothetical protein
VIPTRGEQVAITGGREAYHIYVEKKEAKESEKNGTGSAVAAM